MQAETARMIARNRFFLRVLAPMLALATACGPPFTTGTPDGGASDAATSDAPTSDGTSADGTGGDASGSDGSGDKSDGSTSTACRDYFDAVFGGGCNGSVLPADELTRQRARFVKVCEGELALPGQGLTQGALQACAIAVRSTGACRLTDRATDACNLTVAGALGATAACFANSQCQSGSCAHQPQDGGAESACGSCKTASAIGQTCSPTSSCSAGAACDTTRTPPTCTALSFGDVGATCNAAGAICKTGLYCDANATNRCLSPKGVGAACSDTSQCVQPFVCDGAPRICQSPRPAGATCFGEDCAAGLVCATQSTHVCSAVSWAAEGQACGDTAQCLVGSCLLFACPRVIPDGQPCDFNSTSTTCDAFAQCLNGTCTLGTVRCN